MNFSGSDVFANVAGGMRVAEPGVDLSLALAVASSYYDVPLDPRTVVLGEVGLGGEVRRVSQLGLRLREAAKLGFETAVVPERSVPNDKDSPLKLVPVSRVDEALQKTLDVGSKRNRPVTVRADYVAEDPAIPAERGPVS
jgi:DNA repair protein RadA/Sms